MKSDMILLAVPSELLEEAAIDLCDTLEMFASDGRLIIQQAQEDECDRCPCCRCPARV